MKLRYEIKQFEDQWGDFKLVAFRGDGRIDSEWTCAGLDEAFARVIETNKRLQPEFPRGGTVEQQRQADKEKRR